MPIVPKEEYLPGTTGNSSPVHLLFFLMQLTMLGAADCVVPARVTRLALGGTLGFCLDYLVGFRFGRLLGFRFGCLPGLGHRDHPPSAWLLGRIKRIRYNLCAPRRDMSIGKSLERAKISLKALFSVESRAIFIRAEPISETERFSRCRIGGGPSRSDSTAHGLERLAKR